MTTGFRSDSAYHRECGTVIRQLIEAARIGRQYVRDHELATRLGERSTLEQSQRISLAIQLAEDLLRRQKQEAEP